MAEFYDTDFGYSAASTAELDRIAVEEAGVLGALGGDVWQCKAAIPSRSDGWTAVWVGSRGTGNRGRLVLKGTSRRARRLLREGKLRLWVSQGLTQSQAEILYGLREQFKEEHVPRLVRVLQDPGLIEALQAHPGGFGWGSGRGRWASQHGWRLRLVLEEELSAPREASLAVMVKAITKSAGVPA